MTWGTANGNTEGRMLRFFDQDQLFDLGITSAHNFFLGNGIGNGITGQ